MIRSKTDGDCMVEIQDTQRIGGRCKSNWEFGH